MKKIYIFLSLWCLVLVGYAQIGWQRNDVYAPVSRKVAFVHAALFKDAEHFWGDAVFIIENGKIIAAGPNIAVPSDAQVIDLKGKYIYPAFIDMYADVGLKWPEPAKSSGNQFNSKVIGPYSWNEAIHPEKRAVQFFQYQPGLMQPYLSNGFGLIVSHRADGIMRGTGTMVYTLPESSEKAFLKADAAQYLSFDKGSSPQDYPSSLMGSIALLRQTLLDAGWYQSAKPLETDLSLEAWNQYKSLPGIFQITNAYEMGRADKIARESGYRWIYKTAGDEYQILSQVKALNPVCIVPVNFPKPLAPSDEGDWKYISMNELLHWEQAPLNPALLYKEGIKFALTSDGLKDKAAFLPNIYKSIRYGLPSRAALAALTSIPASLTGMQARLGSLDPGKDAVFFIAADSLGSAGFEIAEIWSGNQRYIFKDAATTDYRGTYAFNQYDTLVISGTLSKPEVTWNRQPAQLRAEQGWLNIIKGNNHCMLDMTNGIPNQVKFISGGATDKTYTLSYQKNMSRSAPGFKVPEPVKLFPFVDFGLSQLPTHSALLIKNATIWTAEQEGVLSTSDLYINGEGKIAAMGKNLNYPGVPEFDATGLHISPGIIDEHSHIAITHGVNEGTQSVTSEVRIGDVVMPSDINIFRQLSGGVTTSHLLHGSANAIGGQTQLVKLRWGVSPEEMKCKPWDGFIKFALGENVKQSNWGDQAVVRYPQTRMGVEQVMYDAFSRAKLYQTQLRQLKSGQPFRRDLELEALVEIMEGKRHITCHSYVQSEINMLMHVADSMGFKVNTFTHILEGYKVADKMKKHGAAGSTFADWWAYKYEVMEAIPYNPFLMYKMGIVTGVNSDDAEMARRLNQESAKSMKYGNMSDTECIKLCTLNPAKMLHIDSYTGSLKKGKDADLVIWSANPCSTKAKVLRTYVDGKLSYSPELVDQLMQQNDMHRKRVIAAMKEAVMKGETSEAPVYKPQEMYNCREDE